MSKRTGKRQPKAKSVERLMARRSPGLNGTYSDTCIACLRPTDTALGVQGVSEWHAAFLVALGVPMKEARAAVDRYLEEISGGPGPDGQYRAPYRVCGDCATRANLPRPALAVAGEPLPTIDVP